MAPEDFPQPEQMGAMDVWFLEHARATAIVARASKALLFLTI